LADSRNAAGFAALDRRIAAVRALPELRKQAAPDVADALERELRRQIAAGTDPDGKPWPLTQDGRKALATAAKSLRVASLGSTVIARLVGHVARHHNARARGGVERRILPSQLTAPIKRLVADVLRRHFREALGG